MIELYFDGLVEPTNPGGHAACGCWITGEGYGKKLKMYLGKGIITTESGLQVQTTNNIAEYCALILGLAWCNKNLPRDCCLRIFGDSKLVVEQVSGRWRCNVDYLQEAVKKCRLILGDFTDYELSWIPRERNAVADQISREVYHGVTGSWPQERHKKWKQG